jgi:hypothetical protein
MVVAAAAWIMIVVHHRQRVVGTDMAGETCPRTEKTHGCTMKEGPDRLVVQIVTRFVRIVTKYTPRS